MEELIKFRPYSFSIEYNEHKNMYESIEEYYRDKCIFVDYEECVRTGDVYVIRVYLQTAVGFYEIASHDCKLAIEKMCEVLKIDGGIV